MSFFVLSEDLSFIKSAGLYTPISVIIPVIRVAGVTSNAGFQHCIPAAAMR